MADIDFVEDIDIRLKVIVLGNGSVGKSSLSLRFAKEIFSEEYKKTLGVDFLQKKKFVKSIGKEVEFNIWDTAGQEYYDAITRRYYKGAQIALLVFSVTDRESFLSMKKWKDKIIDEIGKQIPMYLIMNKIDVPQEQKVVTDEEAVNLAAGIEMCLFRVSVKNNLKIDDIFEMGASDFYNKGMNKNQVELNPDVREIKRNTVNKKEEIKEIGKEKKEELNKVPSDMGFKITEKHNSAKPKKKGCC